MDPALDLEDDVLELALQQPLRAAGQPTPRDAESTKRLHDTEPASLHLLTRGPLSLLRAHHALIAIVHSNMSVAVDVLRMKRAT